MANVSVYNMEGNEVGTIELNDAVFGVKVNEHLVHQAVVRHLANKRQGTQKAKTRSEVSGGGRPGRWQETLEAERDWTCKAGFHPCAAVDRRRRCICANTQGLFQEDE